MSKTTIRKQTITALKDDAPEISTAPPEELPSSVIARRIRSFIPTAQGPGQPPPVPAVILQGVPLSPPTIVESSPTATATSVEPTPSPDTKSPRTESPARNDGTVTSPLPSTADTEVSREVQPAPYEEPPVELPMRRVSPWWTALFVGTALLVVGLITFDAWRRGRSRPIVTTMTAEAMFLSRNAPRNVARPPPLPPRTAPDAGVASSRVQRDPPRLPVRPVVRRLPVTRPRVVTPAMPATNLSRPLPRCIER